MNVFSEKAIEELSTFGLRPFPIMHMMEKYGNQPVKPVTLILRLNRAMQQDEKLLILHGNNGKIEDVTETTICDIGLSFLKVRLDHFS